MADELLQDLPEIVTPATNDLLYITSTAASNASRKIQKGNLVAGLATSGANADITSLSGLTTPLSVAQGGTGRATLTSGSVLVGNGTGAVTLTGTTGTGNFVKASTPSIVSPTLTTPNLGVALATSINGINLSPASSVTLAFTNSTTITFPGVTSTLATIAGTETLTNKTLTAPRIANGGFIADANGNEEIIFTTTTSAVNELTVTNAATGNAPRLAATGGDTNINLSLRSKGNAVVKQTAAVQSDTTSSYQNDAFTQAGWGQFQVNAGAQTGSDAVTFPVAYTTVYSVVVNLIGLTTGAVSGIGSFTTSFATNAQTQAFGANSVTTSGFSVSIYLSTNVGANTQFGYSWIAVGV